MTETRVVYICDHCMTAAEREENCCGHTMVRYDAGTPGSERSKPLYTPDGRLRTHAPRWWLERHGGSIVEGP